MVSSSACDKLVQHVAVNSSGEEGENHNTLWLDQICSSFSHQEAASTKYSEQITLESTIILPRTTKQYKVQVS